MIEKNIFQCYWNRNPYMEPLVTTMINKYKLMNPDYRHYLYNDNDMDNFVNEHFNGEIAECYNKLNITVAKSDFWRYLVLYKYGGIYLDMDSGIEKSLDELIKEDDQAIITAEGNPNLYVQWGLIFTKEHPILKKTIELICNNIKNNRYPNSISKMTGPIVYSTAINEIHKELFNNIINHGDITRDTDITYKFNNISYRLYGIDYSSYFKFKNNLNHNELFNNKKHWRQEEKEKSLLI
jgi:mannosyltransferase OCH1-like enzyme